MKVFVLAPQEDWICDRLTSEWYEFFPEFSTKNPYEADIIWILAGWCWNQIPQNLLRSKKVVVTEHHIVPEKFSVQKLNDFLFRDQFVDAYHVPSNKTREQISSLTNKTILNTPFWVNDKIWKQLDRKNARQDLNLSQDKFLVGSFQRDTEGSDLKSPKMEKGPDIFVNHVDNLRKKIENVHVLLAGWRRQYVMNELNKLNIPYTYFELPDLKVINQLYNALDLYVVGSRYEGGPQSIFECALTKTPIVSTDVGIARSILSEKCILREMSKEDYIPSEKDIEYAYQNVKNLLIDSHKNVYIKFFKDLNEGKFDKC